MKKMNLEEAVDNAINDCIDNHVLEDFFRNRFTGFNELAESSSESGLPGRISRENRTVVMVV